MHQQKEGKEHVHQQKEGKTGKKRGGAANARANGDQAAHATLPTYNINMGVWMREGRRASVTRCNSEVEFGAARPFFSKLFYLLNFIS